MREVLLACFPPRIKPYLFDGESVRQEPFDFGPLRDLIRQDAPDLTNNVRSVFEQGWPTEDSDVVTPQVLRDKVDRFTDELEAVVKRPPSAPSLGDGPDQATQRRA